MIMKSAIAALCLCAALTSAALAQKNNRDQRDEKRENQRVAAAEKTVHDKQSELKTTEQKLRNLMREVAQLAGNITTTRNRWRDTRDEAADELAKAAGITGALGHLKATKAKLAEYSRPILDELHKSEKWQSAKRAADQAKRQAETVREDVDLTDAQREAKLDELIKLMGQPDELDRLAIIETEQGKLLSDEVTTALNMVAKIRKSVPDEKIDAHPTVVKAKQALERAEQELAKHKQSLSAQGGHVAKAKQELQQARQKLEQARVADKKDGR